MSVKGFYFDADVSARDPYYSFSTYERSSSYDSSMREREEENDERVVYCLSGCYVPNISIYSFRNGQMICKDQNCDISTNFIARQLHLTTKSVFDFFNRQFGLCGIDGNGKIPPLFIEWDQDNAVWTCSNEKGDRCKVIFNNAFAIQPEVVTHELTHGAVDSLTSVRSKAIHEHFADVMGIAFKQYSNRAQRNNWTIADRDLSRPIDMDSYYARNDPHYNSLILSHAFFNVVQRTNFSSWEIAKIWYLALRNLKSKATFTDLAFETIKQAEKIDNDLAYQIKESWIGVKVLERIPIQPPVRKSYRLTRY